MHSVQDDFDDLQLGSITHSDAGFMLSEDESREFVKEQILILLRMFSSPRTRSTLGYSLSQDIQLMPVPREEMPPPAKFNRKRAQERNRNNSNR